MYTHTVVAPADYRPAPLRSRRRPPQELPWDGQHARKAATQQHSLTPGHDDTERLQLRSATSHSAHFREVGEEKGVSRNAEGPQSHHDYSADGLVSRATGPRGYRACAGLTQTAGCGACHKLRSHTIRLPARPCLESDALVAKTWVVLITRS